MDSSGLLLTNDSRDFADTWTWDGSTWTKQAPAAHPTAREGASMAYDAATGTIVLFGGNILSGTWTWDGSTWTEQAPAAHPAGRNYVSMAYDAATPMARGPSWPSARRGRWWRALPAPRRPRWLAARGHQIGGGA